MARRAMPVREALQLLRAQGFVLIVHNKSARVRPIDQDFVRDIYEIGVLIEPALDALVRRHGDTDADIAELERIQDEIEANNFADPILHSELDTQFHTLMYERHYNQLAAELWWKHREVLRAVTRRFNFTLSRRAQVMRDHRELIQLVKDGRRRQGRGADRAACRGVGPAHPRADAGGHCGARQLSNSAGVRSGTLANHLGEAIR